MINAAEHIVEANEVAVYRGDKSYGGKPPFSPDQQYPEYPFHECAVGEVNAGYRAVRGALEALGLDACHIGSREWNPLGECIRPGDTVVLKPNFVREFRETQPEHCDCVITHGSIIRAVIDYTYIALGGRGRIVIADAPQNDADFTAIRRITGVDTIQDLYKRHVGFDIEVYDLRPERARKVDGVIVGHEPLPGDPAGYVKVNLGQLSMFAEINHLCRLLYGSEYNLAELHSHQHDDVHEYLISRTILSADAIISLPKLKTHKKTGITVNLKNLVGINGNKNWLPHHREGTPSQGGDQFAEDALRHRVERQAVARFRRLFPFLGPLRPLLAAPIKAVGKWVFGDTNVDTIRSGNWYGNDTTWRMVIDLNRTLLYADSEGMLHDKPARRFFSVVDGIIGGEGNGPLDPMPKAAGLVVAGANPVAVDATCARLMGFDYRRLPMLYRATDRHHLPLTRFDCDTIAVHSNCPEYDGSLDGFEGPLLSYLPHFGWKGHIEWQADAASDAFAGPDAA